eukprot:PITA_27310
MKCISWNIRGLGSKRKQRMLSNIMKQVESDIIFIQETKCSIQKLRQIHSKWLDRFEYLEVKAENTAGGILILWNPQKMGIIDVEASRNYLLVVIRPIGDRENYLVTNVYGPQKSEDKLKFLDSLGELRNRHAGVPWIMGGDFNMIKSLSKKRGGTRALSKDFIAFQTFTYNMNLVDSETSNGLFTWNNKRGGEAQVASKLDRFIISKDLMLIDKEITTRILPFGGSNHWPVQLDIKGIGTPKNRAFRFENIWLSHPDFISNIEKWWSEDLQIQGTNMFLLHKRLKHIKLRLKEWNKSDFDREQSIKEITNNIPKLVSREDNFNINRPVTEEEVCDVLKEMQKGKAPGPDGFNVYFFKVCWNIVKQDILKVVEDSRLNTTMLKALNASSISLIPKQDLAQTPDKYRPIALCNVVYKIISKVVANRLKPLLPSLVSGEQFGYVEGRQILNNIIQAHEVVHSLTSKRQAGMIMQLDIAKAYDKVNWSYIKKILMAFGFDHNWVRLVMALVTSSSFSILVNGSPSEVFIPSRGLRQGDPLSPLLFILMMEGLGRAIKQAKATGKIKSIQLIENGQALTHQQFVDDTMLQGIPTAKEATAYKYILDVFARASAKPMHKSIWEPLINKMQDKVRKWTCRALNLAGRLVLTKAVLQAIPVFMLSTLPAPKGVLQQFKNIQRDFLWGKEETRKKWALVS